MVTVLRHHLGGLDQISDPGSRSYEIVHDGKEIPLFVVHQAGRLRAFRNRCPHTGVNLEWRPHQFLDIDDLYIQCAVHGALFDPEDGRCVRGPCAGDSLEEFDLKLENGELYLLMKDS